MSVFKERVELLLKAYNSSIEFPINKIQTKTELEGLCNKYKIVRILYNGKDLYVWKADEADHSFVKNYIDNSDSFYGFMLDNNKNLILPIEKNKELIDKFKKEYL